MQQRRLFLPCFLFVWLAAPLLAQETATGTVFLDTNENGRFDAGEEGVFDVAVSNGQEVVLTDAEGRYTLEVGDDDILFVIKPSGYRLSVDEQNLPQFFYVHKPDGSPELDYAGVEPTGPLPPSIDFPLLPGEDPEVFSVLLFGDPQPYSEQDVDFFDRDIVAELEGAEGYAFGITLGDIVGDDLDLYAPYLVSLSKVGVLWFHVYGNHDMNFDVHSDSLADETFEATFGPATLSFNHGKAHFILLDDVIYPRDDGEPGYIGGFTEKQLTFIENDLAHVPGDHLVVLAFHIPIFHEKDWGRTFREEDRARLFELLRNHPHTLTLSAHTHYQSFHFFDADDGWPQPAPHVHYNVGTTSGDWWSGTPDERGIPATLMRDGTPNGYATLQIDGNDFVLDYKVAGEPEDHQMSVWGPRVVPQDSWHSAQLYVNYFMGSDSTRVEYRVRGYDDAWRQMSRVEAEDPYVASLREQWDRAETLPRGKRPSNPIPSDHLWKAGVPNNLPLGEHTIDIRVTDMFGRTFEDVFTYRVVEPRE